MVKAKQTIVKFLRKALKRELVLGETLIEIIADFLCN